jgi:hypothetical protein
MKLWMVLFVHMAMKLQPIYYPNYCTLCVCLYFQGTSVDNCLKITCPNKKVLITCRHMDGLPLSQQSNAYFPWFIKKKRASFIFPCNSLQFCIAHVIGSLFLHWKVMTMDLILTVLRTIYINCVCFTKGQKTKLYFN